MKSFSFLTVVTVAAVAVVSSSIGDVAAFTQPQQHQQHQHQHQHQHPLRPNRRAGIAITGTAFRRTEPVRGLPLSASDNDNEAKPKKKRKTKAKAKAKAKAKRKAKAKTKAKPKAKVKTTTTTTTPAAAKAPETPAAVAAAAAAASEEPTPVAAAAAPAKASAKTASPSASPSDEGVEVVHVKDLPVVVVRGETDNDSSNNGNGEVYAGPRPKLPDAFQFDLTGGRPGTIIESEAQLEEKERIMNEVEINDAKQTGRTTYPDWLKSDYGFLQEDEDAEYDNDDPEAIDGSTLGDYDITDLNTKFDWEWDPATDDDPNMLETQIKNDILPTPKYLSETEKDEEGIEVGFDSLFGVSNPIDERTKMGTIDSYMVDENTRDERMLTPEFFPDDPEKAYNEDVVRYRKSLDIIETYQDEFLPESMPVPRNVAKWYGYPEELSLPPKNYTNNRFTKDDDLTNFDSMSPFRARQRAVELARANNAEWMPDGVSQAWHNERRRPYEAAGTLVGTLRKGDIDPDTLEAIRPALRVLGSCAELLSIEGEERTVFRFHYHGLMKNKHGMSCWTETLLRDCGVDVTGVVFETGFRSRDPAYDGGFPYHGWE